MTVLLKTDAFARAEIIDVELDWPHGLAAGRIAKIYENAQKGMGKSVAKRRLILEWARVEPQYADRFIELCCQRKRDRKDPTDHIHFLEPRGDDTFLVVGNPEQLQRRDRFQQRASAGGKGKAAKTAARRKPSDPDLLEALPEADDKQPASTASSTASSTAASSAQSLPSSYSSSLSSSSAVPPKKPPRKKPKGGAPSKRDQQRAIENAAVQLVARAEFAVRSCFTPGDALKHLGEPGFNMLRSKYVTWDAFVKSRVASAGTTFNAQLRDHFIAQLALSFAGGPDPPAQPELADTDTHTHSHHGEA